MANSPSHKLGQIIGYAMEQAFYDMLLEISDEFGLYVDRQGPRAARGYKKFVTWKDSTGNSHNLDFVLERDGTDETLGRPAAFIESAWRRYTKHSVNKAGEIANALVPLRATFREDQPFLGAVIAGELTAGGRVHLTSQGIHVLYLPMQLIVDVFSIHDVDVNFDERTPTAYLQSQVDNWDNLESDLQKEIIQELRYAAKDLFADFEDKIRHHLSREIQDVIVLPLHGSAQTLRSLHDAAVFLAKIDSGDLFLAGDLELQYVEIQIRYNNGDIIRAELRTINDAINWINNQIHLLK